MGQEILTEQEKIERAGSVENWKRYPIQLIDYPSGITDDGRFYPQGRRLVIAGEQVMDTCEMPWCKTAVEDVFEKVMVIPDKLSRGHDPNLFKAPLRVLERGHGLGISGRFIIQKLISLGCSSTYTLVELNHMVAESARNWKESLEFGLKAIAYGLVDTLPNIKVEVIEEDAYTATEKFVKNGRKFDIIFSDTYPLTEAEKGINDITDIEMLKRCLSPNGRLAYFGLDLASSTYSKPPNRTGDYYIGGYKDFIFGHFNNVQVHLASVNPVPDYHYLHVDGVPVFKLPAITCRYPTFR